MTDREMLELAARAGGYVVESYIDSGGAWVYPVGEVPNADGDYPGLFLWSPREDDGDALRLAVQCGILNLDDALFYGDRDIDYQTDPYAATRLAIFRAAAESGRQMGGTSNG